MISRSVASDMASAGLIHVIEPLQERSQPIRHLLHSSAPFLRVDQ